MPLEKTKTTVSEPTLLFGPAHAWGSHCLSRYQHCFPETFVVIVLMVTQLSRVSALVRVGHCVTLTLSHTLSLSSKEKNVM